MLEATVTIVTGGASGLGKATAERFAKQGSRVIICDLQTSKGAEVAKGIGGNQAFFIATDVVSEQDVKSALEFVKDKFGRLDYVVNCAGIVIPKATYDFENNIAHSMEDFNKVIQVNLCGTFNVIRLAAGLMGENKPNKDGERGVIVNVTSIAGYDAPKGKVSYTASKAGVIGMTLTLAKDLAVKGIRVNTVAPGLFTTPMAHQLPEDHLKRLRETVLFPPREGHPDEFAQFVQSIIENPMVNGAVLRIDAGLRVK